MEPDRATRAIRILGAMVGGGLIILGFGELIVRLDELGPLLFWLPTLWGGGGLILFGVFGKTVTPRNSQLLVILGAVIGLLPTMWTVILPVLSVVLVILTIKRANRTSGSAEVST
ncbi:MAG: hypothetical protein ABI590_01680 [Ilumatobacteraceae bacterium]